MPAVDATTTSDELFSVEPWRTTVMSVLGTPAPQGSKRAFINPRTGKIGMKESSGKVEPWREAIVSEVLRHPEYERFEKRVHAVITFYFPSLKAHYRADGSLKSNSPLYVTTTPDIDKLLRSTFDGLTQSGLIVDDKIICAVTADKRYTQGTSGAIIELGGW